MGRESASVGPFAPRRTPDPADCRDFFISWEGTQARNAQWVAETLTDAGYRCYFYPWDNLAGDNYQRRMADEDALSAHVLCVFSNDYFARREDGRRSHAYGEAISALDQRPRPRAAAATLGLLRGRDRRGGPVPHHRRAASLQ